MIEFCQLYEKLRSQSNPLFQSEFIGAYLNNQATSNQEWAIYLMRGGPTNRLFSSAELINIAQGQISFSLTVYERCLDFTADAIEAISLMLPIANKRNKLSLTEWVERINARDKKNKKINIEFVVSAWNSLGADERYIFNRLISNTWRAPIPSASLINSLSQFFNISIHQQAYNLFHSPLNLKSSISDLSKIRNNDKAIFPIDFIKPVPIDQLALLESPSNYECTCEWNGVRAQWVVTENESSIWSARNELITDKLPELTVLMECIPHNTIIDGIILATGDQSILPKSVVRKRLGRKKITPKIASDIPLIFCAIDLLKLNDTDLTKEPLFKRQQLLDDLIKDMPSNKSIQSSDVIEIKKWEDLDAMWSEIREINSSAIIIKHRNSSYRPDSNWYKYKAAPYQAKGVLLYVKRGEGQLSNQYVEYTLGAQAGGNLVPFAKVNPRFVDDDNLVIKQYIKDHTIERFGPVYSVEAKFVFEFTFEAVHTSKRHKCGFVLKNVNFISWNKDESLKDINSIEFYLAFK